MSKAVVEVADIFRYRYPSIPESVTPDRRRVIQSVVRCRTAALGAYVLECKSCNHTELSFCPCNNRHCPKCQMGRTAAWAQARSSELLPTKYFHNVFTLPQELRDICYQNKREVYELFFQSVAETLQEVAANPKRLGAKITFYAILHTWNQKLEYHPHMHVVTPGGGISPDGESWVSCRDNFFLPVRVLGKVFRGKFIDKLRRAYRGGRLSFYGELKTLETTKEFEKLIAKSRSNPWVVYSKRPFGGPEQVVKYLSLYTHRIGISNRRLRSFEDGVVTFAYRDSKAKNKKRLCKLTVAEFCRRFLLHIVPKRFVRIRHYGFLGNARKRELLPNARRLIESHYQEQHQIPPVLPTENPVTIEPFRPLCPCCKKEPLVIVRTISALTLTNEFTNQPATGPPTRMTLH